VTPRYDQISMDSSKNSFHQIVSPNKEDTEVWIYQKAWFPIGEFEKVSEEVYNLRKAAIGVYIFVLEGEVRIYDYLLSKRDAIGITETSAIHLDKMENSKVLLMEVPV
jgi:hypothetical protein